MERIPKRVSQTMAKEKQELFQEVLPHTQRILCGLPSCLLPEEKGYPMKLTDKQLKETEEAIQGFREILEKLESLSPSQKEDCKESKCKCKQPSKRKSKE